MRAGRGGSTARGKKSSGRAGASGKTPSRGSRRRFRSVARSTSSSRTREFMGTTRERPMHGHLGAAPSSTRRVTLDDVDEDLLKSALLAFEHYGQRLADHREARPLWVMAGAFLSRAPRGGRGPTAPFFSS